MKFSCDSCDAQYMISDEKLGTRGVKVRCKRCSHIIIVRPGQDEGAAGVEESISAAADGEVESDVFADDAPAPSESEAETTQVASLPSGFDVDDSDESMDATTEGGPPDFDEPEPSPPSVDFGEPPASFDDPLAETPDPFAAAGDDDDDGESAFGSFRDGDDEESAFASSDEDEDPFGGATDLTSPPDDPFAGGADDELGGFSFGDEADGDGEADDDAAAAAVDDADDPADDDSLSALDEEASAPPEAEPPPPDDEINDSVFGDEPFPDPAADAFPDPGLDALPSPPSDVGAGEGEGLAATQEAEAPDFGGGGGDELDETLAGAFSNLFGEAPSGDANEPVPQSDRGPTAIVNMDEMDALRQQAAPSAEGGGLFDDPGLGDFGGFGDLGDDGAPEGEAEWHIAVDDDDVGPLTLSEVKEHVTGGRLERDGLVWRSGMEEWLPAEDVPEVRALFESLPMPKLDATPPAFDVGAPIDDLAPSPFGGPDEPDPFGGVPDAGELTTDDESWQPHGLTEVYNAANLAEQSAQVSASTSGANAPSFDEPVADDPGGAGWSPGAASALASLVEDEIENIESDSAPSLDGLPPAESSLDDFPAQSAIDASLSGGDSFGDIGGLGDELGGASTLSSAAMPAYSTPTVDPPMTSGALSGPMGGTLGGASVGGMPFVPAQEKDNNRTLLIAGAIGLGVLLLVVLVSAVTIAIVVTRSEPAPVPVAANNPPANPTPTAPGDSNKTDDKTDDKADDKADDKTDDKSDDKPDDKVDADTPDDKGTQVAAASTAREPTTRRRRQPRRTRTEVKDRSPPPPPPPTRRSGKCDPVLDLDCKPSSGGSSSSSKKTTLSKADVLGGIKKNMGSIKSCGRKHSTAGKTIKMEFKISKSGRTRNVRVLTSSFAGTPAGDCVTGKVKTWRFPSYTGSTPPPVRIPLKM